VKKPDGRTVVPFHDIEGFLAPLPAKVVPGIGTKTQEFLAEKGVSTIGDLQKLEGRQLTSWFGKNGIWLWGVVHGQENVEVRNQEIPKSLSVERTFGEDVKDFRVVREEASEAATELIRRVNSAGMSFKVGGLKIRFRGFETHTREKTLLSYTTSEAALKETVDELLDEFEATGKPVRLIGVRVAGLRRESESRSSLDEWATN